MDNKYTLVWDVETSHSIKNNRDFLTNKVTYIFVLKVDIKTNKKDILYFTDKDKFFKLAFDCKCVAWINHNIGFDILYLGQSFIEQTICKVKDNKLNIYDTMFAHRILTGNTTALKLKGDNSLCSYYKISVDYGITKDIIANEGTSNLKEKDIIEYGNKDVLVTYKIYSKQLKQLNSIKDIYAKCKFIPSLQLMIHNGINIDGDKLLECREKGVIHMNLLKDEYTKIITKTFSKNLVGYILKEYTYNSPKLLTLLFCGGILELRKIPKGVTFSDKKIKVVSVKKLYQHIHIFFKGVLLKAEYKDWKKTSFSLLDGTPLLNLSQPVLSKLPINVLNNEYFKSLIKPIKYQKIISSIDNIIKSYYSSTDNKISSNFNIATTTTGRLSSSKPNLQNIPGINKSFLKTCFIPNSENHTCLVLDYSQIEMVCLGLFYNDLKLLTDIKNGMDFHSFFLASQLKETYEKVSSLIKSKDKEYLELRSKIKTSFTFPFVYGASVNLLTESTGLSKTIITTMIENFYNKYCEIDLGLKMLKEYFYRNRKYKERVLFKWGFGMSSLITSPHTINNYPIQGLASEIIKETIIKVTEYSISTDMYITNTVHDSIYISCNKKIVDKVKGGVEAICEKDMIPIILKQLGIKKQEVHNNLLKISWTNNNNYYE